MAKAAPRIGRTAILVVISLLVPVAAIVGPVTDGLELWLDAADSSTLVIAEGDRVERWEGKIKGQGTAIQPITARQPIWVTDAKRGYAAVRFAGEQHLRIIDDGDVLDFRLPPRTKREGDVPFADLAGDLLQTDAVFVRSMAEWAITMKVGEENNGQEAVWPKRSPPPWFVAWNGLSGEALLEADWVRQAIVTEFYRDSVALRDSISDMIARGERMAQDGAFAGTPPELSTLSSIRDTMAALNARIGRSRDDRRDLYEAPWALSDKAFLAAYSYARPNCTALCGADSNGFAIYYLDSYGNKELIYRDQLLSCAMPLPLRARVRPPVFPDVTDPRLTYATLFVDDVYQGMEDVPRGSVKYLRIAQRVGWPFDPELGQMTYIPEDAYAEQFGHWSWAPARVIGDVPVEEDGAVHFLVPANAAVYFQALDERGMEVRRIRSMVSAQPGEVRGCVGCHESRAVTGLPRTIELTALSRPPSVPDPPSWGSERLLGYEWLVQPILDRHCVECYQGNEPSGNLDLTDRGGEDGFVQSFRSLFGRGVGSNESERALVSVSNRFSNSSVTEPTAFNSHGSELSRVLLHDELHTNEVRLTEEEWKALVTWIDANAPYHDTFYNRRPACGGPSRRELVEFSVPRRLASLVVSTAPRGPGWRFRISWLADSLDVGRVLERVSEWHRMATVPLGKKMVVTTAARRLYRSRGCLRRPGNDVIRGRCAPHRSIGQEGP